MIKLALLSSLVVGGCSGFVLHPPRVVIISRDAVVCSLAAKKKKGKKPAAAPSAGGGFGPVAIPKEVDDYAVFPALEQQVADTRIPSPPELLLQPAGELLGEMYDRLDQIYGFPSFNYYESNSNSGVKEEEEANSGSMSFDELISSTGSSSSSSAKSSTTTISDDNTFADLLASATGGQVDTRTTTTTTTMPQDEEDTNMDAISSLPPFSKFRVLHVDPLVIAIDEFFTEEECDRYVAMSTAPKNKKDPDDGPFETRSKTVGKDALAKSQRTSTTWFHHYKNVPELMAKASRLLGLDGIDQWEEPQTVRYRRNEKFTWHLDALSPDESAPSGQRTATLLVYLTDLSSSQGGATIFRDLGSEDGPLKVQPKKGSALVFFPAAGGIANTPFDTRTLHCGEVVDEAAPHDKWISQLWLREKSYTPSAPPGNLHRSAKSAIQEYCEK